VDVGLDAVELIERLVGDDGLAVDALELLGTHDIDALADDQAEHAGLGRLDVGRVLQNRGKEGLQGTLERLFREEELGALFLGLGTVRFW